VEALVGTVLTLKGLDGKELVLTLDEVVTPGLTKTLTGEGFLSHSSGKRGDLIVEFNILFPKRLDEEQRAALKAGPLHDCEY